MARMAKAHFPPLTGDELAAAFADPIWAARYPPVLTVAQAADLLQVPVSTIYDWSSRRLLTVCAQRVGKHLRLYRDRLLSHVFNGALHNNAESSKP